MAFGQRWVWLALVGTLTTFPAVVSAQETVRVISIDAAVHLRPDSTSPVILQVSPGTLLEVARAERDWFAVVLPPDGQGLRRFGYVFGNAVETVVKAPEPRAASTLTPSSQPPAGQPLPEPPSFGSTFPTASRWAREGAVVSVDVPYHRLQVNEIDILTNIGDYVVVPSLNDSRGFSVSVGHRSATRAIEISYLRSTHGSSASFVMPGVRPSVLVFESESVYQRINVDYRRFLSRSSRAQPYILGGVGFPWLRVKEGGLVSGSVVDARYSGVGGDGGGGVFVFVQPRVAVQLGVTYRYDLFLSARGGDADWSGIKDLVSVRGVQVSSGLSFAF